MSRSALSRALTLLLVLPLAASSMALRPLRVDKGMVVYPRVSQPAPEPSSEPEWTVWDTLAECESNGDWHEGDGGLGSFRGGLQWTARTWAAVKPEGAPVDPAEASREQEILAAETLMAEPWGGYQHWPVCSRRVGLR